MARNPGSGTWPASWARWSRCDARDSDSSCSPTITFTRCRWPISRPAERRADKSRLTELTRLRKERFELMAQLERLPDDMVFFTQITMEAAEDPEFLAAMRSAKIRARSSASNR